MERKVERVEVEKGLFVVLASSSGDREEMRNAVRAIMEKSMSEGEELDRIFDLFDCCRFWKERIELADKALADADPTKLSSTIVIGYLSASFSSRKSLPSRSAFYERAKAHFYTTRPKDAAELLCGLE